MKRVAVIGAGSWGTAFSLHLGHLHLQPTLWVREKNVYEDLLHYRENKTFLPGEVLPPVIHYTQDISEAVEESDFVFVAVPSAYCRSIYEEMEPNLSSSHTVISLTKGIEQSTLKRMTQIDPGLEACSGGESFRPSIPPDWSWFGGIEDGQKKMSLVLLFG